MIFWVRVLVNPKMLIVHWALAVHSIENYSNLAHMELWSYSMQLVLTVVFIDTERPISTEPKRPRKRTDKSKQRRENALNKVPLQQEWINADVRR